MNIYVDFEGEREVYIGLREGELVARLYWESSVDSCLEKTVTLKHITVMDRDLVMVKDKEDTEDFVVLDNGKVVNIKNGEYLYYYFVFGEDNQDLIKKK